MFYPSSRTQSSIPAWCAQTYSNNCSESYCQLSLPLSVQLQYAMANAQDSYLTCNRVNTLPQPATMQVNVGFTRLHLTYVCTHKLNDLFTRLTLQVFVCTHRLNDHSFCSAVHEACFMYSVHSQLSALISLVTSLLQLCCFHHFLPASEIRLVLLPGVPSFSSLDLCILPALFSVRVFIRSRIEIAKKCIPP